MTPKQLDDWSGPSIGGEGGREGGRERETEREREREIERERADLSDWWETTSQTSSPVVPAQQKQV